MSTPSSSKTGPASIPPVIGSGAPARPSGSWFRRLEQGGYHIQDVEDQIKRMAAKIRDLETGRFGREAGSMAAKVVANPEAQQSVLDLIKIAADTIEGNRAAAAAEAAQLLADARTTAEQIKAQAEQEAVDRLTGAQQQADTIMNGARSDAKKTTDAAAANAAAVNEAAGRRMEETRAMHAASLNRLQQIHDVTGQFMDAEQQRGSLDDEVARALSATGAVAATVSASASPALSAAPEAISS